jgi:hypothetical protein
MRKLLIVGALALAFVVLAPPVAGQAAPNHDQATGTGALGQFGDPTAHVNAVDTPSGVKGSVTIEYPDGTTLTGTDTCLFVNGNTAYVTARITEASGPRQEPNGWFPGSFVVVGVQDNGEPGTAGPDRVNFSPGFATDPGCGPNGAAVPVFDIVSGNYKVSAATAARR